MKLNLDEWTPARRAHWEKTRSKGRTHFVVVMGAGAWGVPMFLTMSIYQYVSGDPIMREDGWKTLFVNALVYPIGGCLCMFCVWALMEKAYRQATEEKDSTE